MRTTCKNCGASLIYNETQYGKKAKCQYCRTDYGISKLLKIEGSTYTFDYLDENMWSGDFPNEIYKCFINEEIKSHSFNIIDLIEVRRLFRWCKS